MKSQSVEGLNGLNESFKSPVVHPSRWRAMIEKVPRRSRKLFSSNFAAICCAVFLWCLTIVWVLSLCKQLFVTEPGSPFESELNDDSQVAETQVSVRGMQYAETSGVKVDFGPNLPEFKQSVNVTERLEGEPVIFMVMSARSHFEERQAVRDTWGKDMKNVIFVVGGKWCWWPPSLQDPSGPCVLLKSKQRVVARSYTVVLHNRKERVLQPRLLEEQERYGDLLILDMVDSYGNLSGKNLAMLTWLKSQLHSSPWVYKVDDDSIISVNRVVELLEQPSMAKFDFIGHLEPHSPVLKSGRWMELQYNDTYYYPTYPQGSTGYLLNGNLVSKIVAYNKEKPLPIYRCEDAAVGFWTWLHVLKKEGRTPRLHEDPRFVPNTFNRKSTLQVCLEQVYRDARINYGHQLTPESMRTCYEYLSKLPPDPVGLGAPPLEAPDWLRLPLPSSHT
mmetsp:Transcript_14013/g.25047  ORF Transcript_14013/g.25047 Transcript_14013/m.25047 type:complete len:446 (-) Transcript_14013:110-1447(-)